MRKNFYAIIAAAALMTISLTAYAEENDNMNTLRNDDFESYTIGGIYNGSAFLPIGGDAKNVGPASSAGTYFRGKAVDGVGGFTTDIASGMQSNIVQTSDNSGNPTKAVQIIKPKNVNAANARFSMYPNSSLDTAELDYSLDIKNSGKTGAPGEAGYTNEVNNCFGSAELLGIKLDFSAKSLTFEADSTVEPKVSEKVCRWVLPDNGKWFNLRVHIDSLSSKIDVYINGDLIGEQIYTGKYKHITSQNLGVALTQSTAAENAIYFDNVKISDSAMSDDEFLRKLDDKTFSAFGNPVVVYPGSPKVYHDDTVENYFADDASVTAESEEREVYVPIRYMASLFGYNVLWDADTGDVTLDGNKKFVLRNGNTSYTADSEEAPCSEIENKNGRMYVNIKDTANMFGKTVYVDKSGLAMLLSSEKYMPSADSEDLKTLVSLYPEASMGFETDSGWYTMADLLKAGNCTLDALNVEYGGNGRNNLHTNYAIERYGIKRSTDKVKSGIYSGKWEKHNFYPTIEATGVPTNWSSYNTLSFWVYSEANTGEHITVGAVSNPDKTTFDLLEPRVNFFYFGIDIDFTGWKQFELPLEMFAKSSDEVQGFNKIDGLYFYTRAFDYEPSPYTVLYMDDVKLEKLSDDTLQTCVDGWKKIGSDKAALENAENDYVMSTPDIFKKVNVTDYDLILAAKKEIENASEGASAAQKKIDAIEAKYGITGDTYKYSDLIVRGKPDVVNGEIDYRKIIQFNHSFPEVTNQPKKGEHLVFQAYFKESRAMYGYYPKYMPSFTTTYNGFKFIVYDGSVIESADSDGNWHMHDIKMQISDYCNKNLKTEGVTHFQMSSDGFYNETKVRFDKDGDAYMCIMVRAENDKNETLSMNGLLAYSTDNMKTWKFYRLPRAFAKMEIQDGHNDECLERPPVILLHYYWSNNDDQSGSFVIPEKQSDGTLMIPAETVYAHENIICTSEHSGKGNFCVTTNGKVFIVYGVPYPNTPEGKAAALACVPKDSPVRDLKMTNTYPISNWTGTSGVPSYIISYDLKTKQLSEPKFLGCAGHEWHDAHNWSAISVDSEGYLHVFLIGHHSPMVYMKSSNPGDISKWDTPEVVSNGISYASINIGPDDTIYAVTRNSNRGYFFDLAIEKKAKGGKWEEKRVFEYWKNGYNVWGHDVFMDHDTGKLYVTFRSKTNWFEASGDIAGAYGFIYPEYCFVRQGRGDNNEPQGGEKGEVNVVFMGADIRGENTIVVSDDGGNTWKLATTEDYINSGDSK